MNKKIAVCLNLFLLLSGIIACASQVEFVSQDNKIEMELHGDDETHDVAYDVMVAFLTNITENHKEIYDKKIVTLNLGLPLQDDCIDLLQKNSELIVGLQSFVEQNEGQISPCNKSEIVKFTTSLQLKYENELKNKVKKNEL